MERYVVSCIYGDPILPPRPEAGGGQKPVEACVLDVPWNCAVVAAFTGPGAKTKAVKWARRLNREEAAWEKSAS